MPSKIRLDPLSGVFDLRVYAEQGDPSAPLEHEMRDHILVGRVVISGHSATVTVVNGDMGDLVAWADFDAEMLSRGVTEVHWERHKNGKVLSKKRRIKACL